MDLPIHSRFSTWRHVTRGSSHSHKSRKSQPATRFVMTHFLFASITHLLNRTTYDLYIYECVCICMQLYREASKWELRHLRCAIEEERLHLPSHVYVPIWIYLFEYTYWIYCRRRPNCDGGNVIHRGGSTEWIVMMMFCCPVHRLLRTTAIQVP